MSTLTSTDEPAFRARIPADLDAPDPLVAGLSARQIALLVSVAVPGYGLWTSLNGHVPLVVLAAGTAVAAALALMLTLGRRDGLSLDRWLMAAVRHAGRRHVLVPARSAGPLPSWAPPDPGRQPRLGLLQLPAEAISAQGAITTGVGTATALVAAATVTSGLHTPAEQTMLLGGYARWLNSLPGPVQVLVAGRRVDLGPRALHLAENAQALPHPALARAAVEHAEHLLDLSEDGDRLTRTVTIACTAAGPPTPPGRRSSVPPPGGSGAEAEALRRAERTAAALGLISPRCRVLTGAEVTAVLVAATDPYAPTDASWTRTPPATTITTADPARTRRQRPEQSGAADTDDRLAGRVDVGTPAPGDRSEGGWCP